MIVVVAIIGWLICTAAAFAILVRDQKRSFSKVTRGDAAFIMCIALMGPIGLAVAILVWMVDIGGHSKFWSKRLW